MTDFLKNIDWYHDDGVNLPMLNDAARNQFYEDIISQHVNNQVCIDIGFGTGLLSMLALKHGAKFIHAFEYDLNRFKLGQLIIDRLNLSDRINLINSRYSYELLDTLSDVSVVFTETFGNNLWCEGVLTSLPRDSKVTFLPSKLSTEIHVLPIAKNYAEGLRRPRPENIGFNPGVGISADFINLINDLAFPKYKAPEDTIISGLNFYAQNNESEFGWMSYQKMITAHSHLVASHCIDLTDVENIDFNSIDIKFLVDTTQWKNQILLVVPRTSIGHGNRKLYLDLSTGGWGTIENSVIISQPTDFLEVTCSLTGAPFKYELK